MKEVANDELPLGWITAPLSEVVDVLDSKRIPINADERERRVKDKSPPDLIPYYGATGQVGFIDEALFDEPLILLGEDGVPFYDPLKHKAYRVSGKTWVNNHAHVLRARANMCDERFITAFLNSFDYTGYVTGSTRLKLTQGSMNSIPVSLAPLAEQKRIADKLEAVLGRVDACRARLDRVPDILKRFRQSVLAAATSGQLTEDWREEDSVRVTVPLKEAITTIRTGPFGSSLHKSDYVVGGTPIVNPMHINEGKITPTEGMSVDSATLKRLSDFKLSKGDVIIGRRGEMGRCAVVTDKETGWLCGTGSMVLTVSSLLDPTYLQLFLSCPETVRTLEGDSVGSTMVNLNQKILLGLDIFCPPLAEQAEIVRRVEALLALADRIEARLATAQRLVERLTPATLSKAFRGDLVLQDPNDEPASQLLGRIKIEPVGGGVRRRSKSR